MNIKRLKKLSKHLRTLRPTKHRKFNMVSWFGVLLGTPKVTVDKRGNCKTEAPECGTSACALGHACLIPEFRRAGLRLEINPDDGEDAGMPVYKGARGYDAGAAFFSIERWDAEWLFDPRQYKEGRRITPKMVAVRIDALIAREASK